jgi:hypothetical protein
VMHWVYLFGRHVQNPHTISCPKIPARTPQTPTRHEHAEVPIGREPAPRGGVVRVSHPVANLRAPIADSRAKFERVGRIVRCGPRTGAMGQLANPSGVGKRPSGSAGSGIGCRAVPPRHTLVAD